MSTAHEAHTVEDELEIVYTVTRSNNATNYWYDYSTNNLTTYHIENATQFTLMINNASDPQSSLQLSIGNTSFSDVPDWEGEEALGIGYYKVPASFGFIANLTWTDTKFAMDQAELVSLDFSLPKLNYLGGQVDAVIFEFGDVSQKTTIIYDSFTGILLEASSNVFGFDLAFTIDSINGDKNYHKVDEPSETSERTLEFQVIGLFGLIVLPFIAKYHRK